MHIPALISDLAVILGVAALVTFLFKLIRQPVVLGYIVAGIIVGPHTPTGLTIFDKQNVMDWAELGVIFLMFSLGLEFSFRRLAKVGMSATITATIQMVTMLILGFIGARMIGWNTLEGAFLGCMLAMSSTTIIIKALDELGLKKRRFAELVFGMLIVEDLAAIIIMVALTNIATQATVSGTDLLIAGSKLGFMVAVWFIVGMFLVPRFIRAVGQRGNDEMLTVVSLGLCLGLVYLSAYFNYSVALGAFIMGSILAETREVHRIESLMGPLKDVFGAVFFVSVGMLLDPNIIMSNLGPIALLCFFIIVGKILSVTLGALSTGQSLSNSVHAGLSMAQIGEFSFIIASLGLTLKAINQDIYPIIVTASLITTFTTPYFIKASPAVTRQLEKWLPKPVEAMLIRYNTWFQNRSTGKGVGREFYVRLIRWIANGIVVITIFLLSGDYMIPLLQDQFDKMRNAKAVAWVITFICSAPFIWAMLSAFRPPVREQGAKRGKIDLSKDAGFFLSRLVTIMMVGLLSIRFFPAWLAVLLTIGTSAVLFLTFKGQIEGYYRWFEGQFVSGFAQPNSGEGGQSHAHLVPWDAHLAEIKVNDASSVVGKSLLELQIRERFGVNVVVIKRLDEMVVAPQAQEKILPADILACFGTEEEIDRFRAEIENPRPSSHRPSDLMAYALRQVSIIDSSRLADCTIKSSGIRESFDCMVVGVERSGVRIQNPKSDLRLKSGDLLWIVGQKANLEQLAQQI